MTGIDAIIRGIIDEANDKANIIINDAKAEAERRVAEAKAEKNRITEEASKRAEEEYSAIIKKGNSSVNRRVSEMKLANKQEIINKVINKAYSLLVSMNESDYEKFIFSKLESLDVCDKSVIKFASRGNNDIGLSLKAKLKLKYPKLEISDESVDGDGGFIIVNGMIEENMTFAAIFKDKLEEIKDMANRMMFEEDAQ